MKIARRAGVVLGSIAAAIATLAAGMPARAAADAVAWRIVSKVHYGTASNASGYSAVVAPAADDAWAFGGTNPGGPSVPAAERWNGHRWQSWPLPRGLTGFIVAAAASSPRNVWAVAEDYALRWNGTRWTVAKTWSSGGEITSVAVVSPSDVWVFGSSFSGEPGVGTWHYNGRTWARLSAAAGAGASVYRASAVWQRNIWGITAGPRGGSVVHYNGTDWQQVAAADAALGDAQLDDVLAVSWHNVWVSGTTPATATDGRLVLAHWNGRSWQRRESPWRVQQAERFATDGAGGVWIPVVTGGDVPTTWMLHMSWAGTWARVEIAAGSGVGVGVGDLAVIPGTSTLWGTGGLVTAAGGDAAIWDHGVTVGHLTVRDRQPGRAHVSYTGRGVIRVWMIGGNGPVAPVYLVSSPAEPLRLASALLRWHAAITGD